MNRYKILLDVARVLYNAFKDMPAHLAFVIGLIAEGLHRMTPIHTGLISEEASKRKVKICKEHFFGRTASARIIMKKIGEGKWSDERLVLLIKSRCRVHYTTSAENMKLRKYDHLHWRKAYEAAGIKLIPFVDARPKYVYSVAGKVYNTLNEVAKEYGMSMEAMRNRFTSTRDKWNQWTRTEK
jgi:hypothetical protein